MNKKQKEAKTKFKIINDFMMAWRKAHMMDINSEYTDINKKVLLDTYMEINYCSVGAAYKRFNMIKHMFNSHKEGRSTYLCLQSDFWIQVQKIRKAAGVAQYTNATAEQKLDAIDDAQNEINTENFKKYFMGKEVPPWVKAYEEANKKIDGENMKLTESQRKIKNKCRIIEEFLLQKNKQYGDSVLAPIRVFSKANSDEQIRVRIDDKLNRLLQGDDSIEKDEDVIMDLIGYLILLLVSFDE